MARLIELAKTEMRKSNRANAPLTDSQSRLETVNHLMNIFAINLFINSLVAIFISLAEGTKTTTQIFSYLTSARLTNDSFDLCPFY